jgi:hypothetical protein
MDENKQTDLEEVIQEVEQGAPEKSEKPNVTKVKMQTQQIEPEIHKVDLSKSTTNETEEGDVNDSGVAGINEDAKPAQVENEVQSEGKTQEETRVLEEVTEELAEEAVEAIQEAEDSGKPLPDNIQKLVDFIEDTGGDINDYVKLNVNVDEMDGHEALHEYYKQTKPHLSEEERSFIMEDKFKFDEDLDDEKEIRKKKIALKEQVAEAKTYLDGQKSKYYEEIKAGSKLTGEQQKAIDFFNRYNKESEQTQKVADRQTSIFNEKTEQVFNDKFKGFEYNVGDKKYRFNVNNTDQVKGTQSDITNFIKKFLNEDGTMEDAGGYHKSLYTAMNADAIAQHFYEQGKADAIKDTVAKAKNINTEARSSHGEAQTGGFKFKVLGNDADSLKLKMKRNKN